MVLSRRAAALALAGVLAVVFLQSWWAVLGATAVVLIVLAVDIALCPSPRRVRIRRGGDTSVRLGETAGTWLLATNTGKRRLRGALRTAWPPSAGAQNPVQTIDIPAGQRRRVSSTLRPTRRGDRHSGPVVIRALGPLRMAGRQYAHSVGWRLRALPPFNSRKHLPSRLARLRELDGRATLLQRGQGTEFDSLREYVPGDDVRSIDWRGTARSSTVVVKTWRPERDRHVLIVLDSGRTSAGRVGDQPRLDHAMDAALLLAALASRAGDRVDLLITDRAVRGSVQRVGAAEVLPRFVNEMADVEAVLAESDYTLMVTEILTRVSQRSLVVVLTGLDEASLTEGLVPVLGPLRRKHRIVVAAVSDPRVDELLQGTEDSAAAYAAAAAERDVAGRQETEQTLRRLGLTVVQAPPDRIAPELADHYLALKKAGQL
ncbi:MAG: DUF58 domain-containing protein [Propionibacteriaceae bacterium]